MPEGLLAIISDDLTGALDAAAPFCGGASVAVATRPDAIERALALGAAVVSVSTRSREVPAEVARARVAGVLSKLPTECQLFKKVDSRLKGNIRAEMEAFDGPVLAVPAIPEFGRIVIGGALQGFGVEQPIDVAKVVSRSDVLIPETRCQQDIVQALAAADNAMTLMGARGLSQGMAQARGYVPPGRVDLGGSICFAVGSTDPITLAQVEALRASYPDLVYIEAPSGRAVAQKQSGPITLVQATPGPEAVPDAVAKVFAETSKPYLEQANTVVLSGGATAEAALDALGADLLTVVGEALPGMPVSYTKEQKIVTKSGGFGDIDAFAILAEMAMTGAGDGAIGEAGFGTNQ